MSLWVGWVALGDSAGLTHMSVVVCGSAALGPVCQGQWFGTAGEGVLGSSPCLTFIRLG